MVKLITLVIKCKKTNWLQCITFTRVCRWYVVSWMWRCSRWSCSKCSKWTICTNDQIWLCSSRPI